MTVVVGILCNDNSVVIGSDSAMNFGMQEGQLYSNIKAKNPDISHHDSHIVPGIAQHRIHLVNFV